MPSDREERIAVAVVITATVWLTVVLCWGLFSPLGGDHDAIVASRGIIEDNILKWHIRGPVGTYVATPPTIRLYDVQHPWGTFWIGALLMKLFGRHAFVPRLEPVLMGAATPALLYGIGRLLWGPVPGALAALAYAVLPIVLATGNLPSFEVPLVFGCLLTAWGYLRFQQRWRRRWMFVSLAGVLLSANADWGADLFLVPVLGTLLVAGYFMPEWFGRVPARRFGQWWSLSFLASVLTLFGYVAFIKRVDGINAFLASIVEPSAAPALAPAAQQLQTRHVQLAFTPVAVAVGKLALPIFIARFLLKRRVLEIFPLALLALGLGAYHHFKKEGDVDPAVLLRFAPYCALSFGVLARTAIDLARSVVARFDVDLGKSFLSTSVLGSVGILPLVMIPDGTRSLDEARVRGGRVDDRDKSQACEWMASRMDVSTSVELHSSIHATSATRWALRRPVNLVDALPAPGAGTGDRYFVADLSLMKPVDQIRLAKQFHLVALGQFVMVDRAAPYAPADGYSFDFEEPHVWNGYLRGGAERVHAVREDPAYTWELRETFGQTPNPPPVFDSAPKTLETLRIAHNVAVASGDSAKGKEYEDELVSQLDPKAAAKFTDGTLLLGEQYTARVVPVLSLFFLVAGPAAMESLEFEVQSDLQKGPWWSLVQADKSTKPIGARFVTPAALWRSGFIYEQRTTVHHRPGVERLTGFFVVGDKRDRAPKAVDGTKEIPLLTLH